MNHPYLLAAAMAMASLPAFAQKTMYMPQEWRNRTDTLIWAESDPTNSYTWSKTRSVESDNVIVLWDKGYGSTRPSQAPEPFRVDEQDLLLKCEAFYDLEINRLGFVDPDHSNLTKYKVMVLLNHTRDWVCYGGGYDFQISALWLGPSACKPVGSAVAHEVGHSFHYMCFAEHSNHTDSETDNTGFHLRYGNGQAIWETTANWQALQSYPAEFFTMSGMADVFAKSHNLAFAHEWHRYQAYPFLCYLCQRYDDITTVAQVWNTPVVGQNNNTATGFETALMRLKGINATELYRLHFEAAMHAVTWDLDAARPYRNNSFIGNFKYNYVKIANRGYQVAYASVPQASGFNVIPLQVPAAGTTITTTFTALKPGCALADGDPAMYLNGETQYAASGRTKYNSAVQAARRGFRLGYVALLKNGTTDYFYDADRLFGSGTAETAEDFALTVPANVSRLWLVVSATPTAFIAHRWDENHTNDDQWPYTVRFAATDILGEKDIELKKDQATLAGTYATDISLLADGHHYVALESKTGAKVIYFAGGNQDALYGTLAQATADAANGFLFTLQKPRAHTAIDANDYVLKVFNGQMKAYTNWDGSNNYLNLNPQGQITFCLANTNVNGRDMVNGGAWDIVFDDTQQAFAIKNVALGRYLNTTLVASATPVWWRMREAALTYDRRSVDIIYAEVRDMPMDTDVRDAMEAARQAYTDNPSAATLNAYGDAVVAAQASARDAANGIRTIPADDSDDARATSNGSDQATRQWHDLSGRAATPSRPGIYVSGGRKVVVR
ncbi:MAG: hypothetical protein IJS59_10635 [Bacteroidaceae bacterium]|nr:hypothetical protein [Bacteroidaceae bacterium]